MVRKGGTKERNAPKRDHEPATAHSNWVTPALKERPRLKTDLSSGIAELLKTGGRDLKRIGAHCVKHGPQLTGEIGSIRDVSLYEKLKKEFNGLMTSRMENPTVLRDKRNQRYTEHSINKEAVSMLNVIIKEYLIDHPVNDMTHLAIIYQTAQDCHDIVAYKPYVNRMFELFTGRFFRNLEQKHQVDESQINSGMLIDYWSQMWTKATEPPTGVERYTTELTSYAPMVGFPDRGEFETIIKHTDNWKSPGADGIFNYYIKWLTELHDILHRQTMKVALGEAPLEEWMCRGITYLFPKNDTPTSASQYRPITCMSNLYKITTKCVTEALQREIKIRGLLTENQMGTMRKVQGAKEHALANIAINAAHNCRLYSTWIDITKAFDSVDHVVLEHVIRRLKLPNWMTNFILDTIKRWTIDIRWHKECIIEGKKIERGILQGDSLSPLLFVLCMDPLSRRLRQLYPSVQIRTSDSREFGTNHLLYIDDLKLLAKDEDVMQKMTKETEEYLTHIGLIINRDKSATNSSRCADTARLLEGPETYKYLGITETRYSSVSRGMYSRIREEIKKRVNMLLDTDLSAKNLFRAVNQYALTVPNYYIGVVPMEPYQFARLDRIVRTQLYEKGAHKHCANISRLYLPRKELGGGGMDSVDLEESTLWLRKSMLTPQEEAKLINLQDRNLQWMSSKKNHKKCGKYLDVEHLASKCDRLLHTDYVRRHNEVARRIHRTLAKELGVKNIKKVERYKIDDRKFTKNGWISYDMSIHTEKKVQFNRPDIIVADNARTASP
ncbi:reverse-transcriptase domain containing protein,putative [Babesia caballi]|uniref:Reverse-transcriptase domain containing protein,putative n=1 Tax=Babesia caballi TaxID=5871 RepID=A0AAV4M090_BABCB|nr:reverse-transcriptase domain containing protein,putative [Babesia caballi]